VTTTPKALLERAADIIDRRGLYQGDYMGSAGNVCTFGAMLVAVAEEHGIPERDLPEAIFYNDRIEWDNVREIESAAVILARSLGIDELDIPDWNDDAERTREDVISALRVAAEAAE